MARPQQKRNQLKRPQCVDVRETKHAKEQHRKRRIVKAGITGLYARTYLRFVRAGDVSCPLRFDNALVKTKRLPN